VDKKTVRVLILDDSADDAELIADALRAGGYRLKTHRVQDMPGMQSALAKGPWDVVISEMALANFEAQHALDLLRRSGSAAPLIVATRKIADADVLKIMRAGARDVILKANSARLVPAVEREIDVARQRAEHLEISESVREIEDKHRALIEGSREAICYCHDGMHIDANRAYLQMFGYESMSELEGVPMLNLLDASCHAQVKECMRRAGQSDDLPSPCEFVGVRRDGTRFAVEFAVSTVKLRGEPCFQINVTDVSRRKAVEGRLQFLNQRDPLTSLYNRHFLLQELTRAVDRVTSGGEHGSLLYIDIDQLKEINDNYGYAAGDRLLLRIARLLREKLRDQDVVARYGGDEFVVLMPGVETAQAEEVRDALAGSLGEVCVSEGGQAIGCRCALSLTAIEPGAGPAHKILAAAYQSCQRSKTRQPAAPVESTETSTAHTPAQTAAPSQRTGAPLPTDRLRLLFQPIVNLQTSDEESYEVFARLQDADGQLIAAAEFLPAFERDGMLPELDYWVLQQGLAVLAALHKTGKRTNFFINLSTAAIHDPGVGELLTRLLADLRVKPSTIVLELSESDLIAYPDAVRTFVDHAHRLGCRIAIDDFGERIGAISKIGEWPVDYLKLTSAYMDQLGQDEISQTLVQALVHVGRNLEKRIVAKSVQDPDALSLLWRYGVDYVQGNLFQAPEPELAYAFQDHSVSSDQAVAGWISAGRS